MHSAFKTPTGKSISDPISWGEIFRITHTESLLNTLLTVILVNRDEASIFSRGSSVLTHTLEEMVYPWNKPHISSLLHKPE